ncbi:unnamed protein product, partial [marine sediment metagenome]
ESDRALKGCPNSGDKKCDYYIDKFYRNIHISQAAKDTLSGYKSRGRGNSCIDFAFYIWQYNSS